MFVLDLYCGCGGFSLGFKNAMPDAEIVGVDLEEDCLKTYHYNGVGQAIRADARHLPIRLEPGYVDIIIGGPPCEPFTRINRQRRGAAHPLYDLVLWFLHYVAILQPKAWVMENVPDIAKDPMYKVIFASMKNNIIWSYLASDLCLEDLGVMSKTSD